MPAQLNHTYDDALEYVYDGVPLCRHVYRPQTPRLESPKPYFYPLRTLSGNPVSIFRPSDHLWHHGLAMTFALTFDTEYPLPDGAWSVPQIKAFG